MFPQRGHVALADVEVFIAKTMVQNCAALDFRKRSTHNAGVMEKDAGPLLAWARRRGDSLFKVTVGQLVTLLELCGSESVAAMGGRSESQAVNYRQKLHRLEKALGVGPLTKLQGKRTRVTSAGAQIASEVRLLLQEIRSAGEAECAVISSWVLGAGDTWLQSVIAPALAELGVEHDEWRWEMRSLKAHDVCSGLREGTLHFGFVRVGDAERHPGLELSRPFEVGAFDVFAGECTGAPRQPVDLLRWLVREGRPLVQQGSTWGYLRDSVARSLKENKLLKGIEPTVRCETHTQAAVATLQSKSWCIVPSALTALYNKPSVRVCRVVSCERGSEMALATYHRSLAKFSDGLRARDELRKALGRAMRL